jgi:hypothetical protein
MAHCDQTNFGLQNKTHLRPQHTCELDFVPRLWSPSRSRKEFSVESEGIFWWSRGRKEFLGGVGVGIGKNVSTPTLV